MRVRLPSSIVHLLLLIFSDLWSTIESFSFPVPSGINTRASWLWSGRQFVPSTRASGRLLAAVTTRGIVIEDGVDGSKLLTDGNQTLVIGKKTMDVLQSSYGNLFARRCSGFSGYPQISGEGKTLHQQVMSCYPEEQSAAEEKWRNYFTKHPEEEMVILHLNRNPLDFNIENLMWGPMRLSRCLYKTTAHPTKRGNKFWGKFQFNGTLINTKLCDSPEEALHHVDILKLTAPNIPEEFLETIFLHGLNRPPGYEHLYDSPQTLIDRAALPEYQTRSYSKPTGKRKGRSAQYTVFHSMQAFLEDDRVSEELSDSILGNRTLGRPKCEPFSEGQDCIVLYEGARGKKIAVVLEQNDFPLLKDRRGLHIKTDGDVQFIDGDKESLHQTIMGYAEGKLVSHGPGKVLDNRRRTLRHASWSEISSNRGNPTSQYHGVAWSNSSGKWQAKLCIFEDSKAVHVGLYTEEAEAGAAADFVGENKAELRLRAAGMTKEDRNKYVRHCCSKKEIVDGTNHPLLCRDGLISNVRYLIAS